MQGGAAPVMRGSPRQVASVPVRRMPLGQCLDRLKLTFPAKSEVGEPISATGQLLSTDSVPGLAPVPLVVHQSGVVEHVEVSAHCLASDWHTVGQSCRRSAGRVPAENGQDPEAVFVTERSEDGGWRCGRSLGAHAFLTRKVRTAVSSISHPSELSSKLWRRSRSETSIVSKPLSTTRSSTPPSCCSSIQNSITLGWVASGLSPLSPPQPNDA